MRYYTIVLCLLLTPLAAMGQPEQGKGVSALSSTVPSSAQSSTTVKSSFDSAAYVSSSQNSTFGQRMVAYTPSSPSWVTVPGMAYVQPVTVQSRFQDQYYDNQQAINSNYKISESNSNTLSDSGIARRYFAQADSSVDRFSASSGAR